METSPFLISPILCCILYSIELKVFDTGLEDAGSNPAQVRNFQTSLKILSGFLFCISVHPTVKMNCHFRGSLIHERLSCRNSPVCRSLSILFTLS